MRSFDSSITNKSKSYSTLVYVWERSNSLVRIGENQSKTRIEFDLFSSDIFVCVKMFHNFTSKCTLDHRRLCYINLKQEMKNAEDSHVVRLAETENLPLLDEVARVFFCIELSCMYIFSLMIKTKKKKQ